MTILAFRTNTETPQNDAVPIESTLADPTSAAGEDLPYNAPEKLTRRGWFKFLIPGAAAAVGAVALGRAYSNGALENLLDFDENINILSVPSDPDSSYAEFRGSTFKFYKIQATATDTGVLDLVYRANTKFGNGRKIKGDISSRATDLFSIMEREGINPSQLGTYKFAHKGSAGIRAGEIYNVPVYVK